MLPQSFPVGNFHRRQYYFLQTLYIRRTNSAAHRFTIVEVPLSETTETQDTRRGFFIGAIYALGAVISAAPALPAAAYLLLPAKVKKQNPWADAGDIAQIAPNSPVEMAFRRQRVDGWRVLTEKGTAWVVKQPDNQIVAFGPSCTHLGCAYHWEAKRMIPLPLPQLRVFQ